MGGDSGHPIAMKPFEYGKFFPDKISPKKNLNLAVTKKCNFAKRSKKPLDDGKKSYRCNQCKYTSNAESFRWKVFHCSQCSFSCIRASKLVISKYTFRPNQKKSRLIVINAIFQPLCLCRWVTDSIFGTLRPRLRHCSALKTLKSKRHWLTDLITDKVTYWAVLDSWKENKIDRFFIEALLRPIDECLMSLLRGSAIWNLSSNQIILM